MSKATAKSSPKTKAKANTKVQPSSATSTPESPPAYSYPELCKVGALEPEGAMLQRVLSPDFDLGNFTQGDDIPAALRKLLADNGFEPDDHADMGMLFACLHGVTMHEDEKPSALWVLAAQGERFGHPAQELICGNSCRTLETGDVLLFDARKRHGVIASVPGLWAVYSVYIRRIGEPESD